MTVTTVTPLFTLSDNTYRLVVPATNAIATTEWLTAKGCQFDRYFRSAEQTVKFVFIVIPEIVVCQISSKYGCQVTNGIATIEAEYRQQFDNSNPDEAKALVMSAHQDTECPESIKAKLARRKSFARRLYVEFLCNLPEVSAMPPRKTTEQMREYYWNQFNDDCNNVVEAVVKYKELTTEGVEEITPEHLAILDEEFDYYLGCCGFYRDENGNIVEGCPEDDLNDDEESYVFPDNFDADSFFFSPFEVPYYFADCYTSESIKSKYRQLAKIYHPDCGGSASTFNLLSKQYQEAIANCLN